MIPEKEPRNVVYLTYDGLSDPLGQSQVLPYLRGLAERGHHFHIVSFEKPPHLVHFSKELAPNIRWTALRYHKTPTVPATAWDMVQGFSLATLRSILENADLLHVRSFVPCAMALPLARLSGVPLLFDTRSFWPDEKVDVGHWSRSGGLYSTAKKIERVAFRQADAITMLTNDSVRYLREEYPYRGEITAPIWVIPTCTDLSIFRSDVPPEEGLRRELEGYKTLLYLGSVGKWYMPEVMVQFYLEWRELAGPSRFLVVTRGSTEEIEGPLRAMGLGHEVIHRSASREQVSGYTRCADAAISFIHPAFSKRASAPTKLGEVLGCGLPVVANPTGDVANVLKDTSAGVVLERIDREGLREGAQALLERCGRREIAENARQTAERWFSLEQAVKAYDELYQGIRRPKERRRGGVDRAWPR